MSNTLTKNIEPGSLGTPGSAGNPPYCVDIPTVEPIWIEVGKWYPDPSGYGGQWIGDVVYGGTHTVMEHTCFPGTAGTPPTPGTGPYITARWDGAAVSSDPLPADGEYQFKGSTSASGVVTGLSNGEVFGVYQNLQFGFYLTNGQFQVMELGAAKTSLANFSASDVFTITTLGGLVRYYKNSTLIYTSTARSQSPLRANACLYVSGDQVINASLNTEFDATFGNTYGDCAGVLTPLRGFALAGGANAGGWEDNGTLTPLTGSLAGYMDTSVAGILTPLRGFALDDTADPGGWEDNATLTPLTGYAESGLLIPQFATVAGVLTPVDGYAVGGPSVSADVAGTLTRLTGFALANNAPAGGWEDFGTLTPLTGQASEGIASYFISQLSGYSMSATGHQLYGVTYGFNGTLSSPYTVHGQGGGYARMKLSSYTLVASGTLTTLGEAQLSLSGYQMLATGTGVILGRAYLVYGGSYKVAGQFGGTARIAHGGGYSVSGHGMGGAVGSAELTIHHCTVSAHGTQGAYGIVAGVLTGLSMVPEGQARITGPRFTIVAHGYNSATSPYEAYSHTLLGDNTVSGVAVTHYTNYPFDRIIRFGTKYYGVGADGMFELAGNYFDGDPIVATVQTGETDMGEPTLKRTRHLYLAGRLSQDLSVAVIARENETDTYTYDPVLGGARSTRVTLGRGLEARYLAFKFINTDGQDFELHDLAPEVDVMRRTA